MIIPVQCTHDESPDEKWIKWNMGTPLTQTINPVTVDIFYGQEELYQTS